MKTIFKLFVLTLTLLSSLSFAQTNYGLSHSYFLTDDGRVHTVRSYKPQENLIKLFSPNGFFILPEDIVLSKDNYLIDDNGKIYTSDTNGYFYEYDYESQIESKIRHAGGSFFITRNKSLHIILSNGVIKTLSRDEYELDSKVKEVGGNYLITRKNTVYIINPFEGSVSPTGVEVKRRDINILGGNYLITKEGVVYSFGLKPDGTKVIKTSSHYKFVSIKKAGGNYFFTGRGKLYTIAANGKIDTGISFNGYDLHSKVAKFGTNYFVLDDNSFYIIDHNGFFHFLKKFDKRIIHTTR